MSGMSEGAQLAIYEAWERHAPGVTKAEVDALVPVVMGSRRGPNTDMIAMVVAAYRAGRNSVGIAKPSSTSGGDVTVLTVDIEKVAHPDVADTEAWRVVVHVGEHRFYSTATFGADGIVAAREETEAQLRGWVGITAAPRGWERIAGARA